MPDMRPLVPQLVETIRRLNDEGYYSDEIAKKVNRDIGRVRYHARNNGIELTARPTPRAIQRQANLERAKALFSQKKSITQVAAILGVEPKSALRYKKDLGLVEGELGPFKPQGLFAQVEAFMEDKMPPSEIQKTLDIGHRWLSRHYPDYKYSEFDDVIPTRSLFYALEKIPDRLEKVELWTTTT